jgi:ubiquinol-cytochrome c reductase cytochrome b subunit
MALVEEGTTAWEFLKTKLLYKPLSKDIGWWYTLGSLCLFLFAVQVITGIVLACNYIPTLEKAYNSVEYIQKEMAWGWLIRGIHHWGSHLMLIVVCIHMGRVFFHGGYKKPNGITWITGLFLVLFTAMMALTGYILPWSDRSYWAATILAKVFEFLPVIGIWLANMAGGIQTGGLTISRYCAFHMVLIPMMMGVIVAIHLFLIQIYGELGPPPKGNEEDVGTQPFFPYQLSKDVVVSFLMLIALVLLARYVGVPYDAPAAPLASIESVPKPEWFILFGYEVLKMFEGKTIVLALTVVPVIGILLVFLLPYYDKNKERAYTKRPIAMSCGVGIVVVLLLLTLVAYVSSPLPGKFFAPDRPDRPLQVKELAGMALFEKNVCYSCHSIEGIGMKHAPDLWKVGTKRDANYIRDLLKDPDKTIGTKGKMVSYKIDSADINALVGYLSSINFMRYDRKIVEPAVFRSAYIVYRNEAKITGTKPEKRQEKIQELLMQNKKELKAKSPLAKTSDEEIARIANDLASLYK